MALPNLMYYYWAANLQKIVYWIQKPDADWCQPEINGCTSSSLTALVTSKLPFSPKQYSSCPVVISTLKIWSQFRQNFDLTDFSLHSPICNNHVFLLARLDPVFAQWQKVRLNKFRDLDIDGNFTTFDALSNKFNLQRSNLFHYIQIHHFVHTISPCFPNLPSKKGIEIILQTPIHNRGLI